MVPGPGPVSLRSLTVSALMGLQNAYYQICDISGAARGVSGDPKGVSPGGPGCPGEPLVAFRGPEMGAIGHSKRLGRPCPMAGSLFLLVYISHFRIVLGAPRKENDVKKGPYTQACSEKKKKLRSSFSILLGAIFGI